MLYVRDYPQIIVTNPNNLKQCQNDFLSYLLTWYGNIILFASKYIVSSTFPATLGRNTNSNVVLLSGSKTCKTERCIREKSNYAFHHINKSSLVFT